MKWYEILCSILGWIGFALLIPVTLGVVGINGPLDASEKVLGISNLQSVATLISFVFIALMVIFGGGDNISPTLIAFFVGFFLISSAVDFGFLRFIKDLSSRVGLLQNQHLNYLCGVGVLMIGLLMSYFKRTPIVLQLFVFVLCPVVLLSVSYFFGVFRFTAPFDLSLERGFQSILNQVESEYRDERSVREYINELANDKSLTDEQRSEKLQRLQDKISKLERDLKELERVRRINERYRKLLENQANNLETMDWCFDSRGDESRVTSISEAVRSDKPCVRDFSVHVAMSDEGSFSPDYGQFPGREGIRQVCRVHTFVTTRWKYISDPLLMLDDYYSPADRTLALELAGDCDDYAIMIAACVEAVGGTVRIMGGECTDGAHAWCEVLIGSDANWTKLKEEIDQFLPGSQSELSAARDDSGFYWLPLDWEIGKYTCNETQTEVLYIK